MNIDRKFLVVIALLIAILLMLLVGVRVSREAPRFNTSKIPSLFIARNWPTNQRDSITLSGHEFTCQEGGEMPWNCIMMLEGKRLEMHAEAMTQPFQIVGCRVVYGGTPYACEVTLGNGWQPTVMVNTDMGISAARMADLRAQRPLIYLYEEAWIGLGTLWASTLAFLVTLVFLAVFNKIPGTELSGVRVPIWLLCLGVIGVAALITQMTGGVFFLFPLAAVGTVFLLMLIVRLNHRDRKHGPSLAHPVMWASVSLVAFWVTNIPTLFTLLALGFID